MARFFRRRLFDIDEQALGYKRGGFFSRSGPFAGSRKASYSLQHRRRMEGISGLAWSPSCYQAVDDLHKVPAAILSADLIEAVDEDAHSALR